MLCAHCAQEGFDELSAANAQASSDLGFMQENFSEKLCWDSARIKSHLSVLPAGIDDFLADYTLQPRSIRDFISCLDDPGTQSFSDESKVGLEKSPSKNNYANFPANAGLVTLLTAPSEDGNPKENIKHNKGKKALRVKSATISKKVRLSPEKREERRREQNREAQRRFRERHMFNSYQTSIAVSCSSGWASEPSFRP
jgi:hypothetical protein